MAKWLTSDTLIASVKRRAMLPSTSVTFTETDFLAFANEEMDIGIIPQILHYHQDYLMQIDYIPVNPGRSYYEIPSRSTGSKVRMVNYVDPSGNVFEMTRVLIEDLPYYQNGSFGISNQGIRAFFIENDEIVMLPVDRHNLTGNLQVSYYLRPNELVPTANISNITGFNPYTGVINVDTVPMNLSSVAIIDLLQTKSPHKRLAISVPVNVVSTTESYYQVGNTPVTQITCSLPSAIPSSSFIQLMANGNIPQNSQTNAQSGDTIVPSTLNQNIIVWYDKTGSDPIPGIAGTQYVRVNISAAVTIADVVNATVSAINTAGLTYYTATNITNLLQINTTLVGSFSSIGIPPNIPFTQVVTNIPTSYIPDELIIGDYVAQEDQCIIPNVPTDLHSMLAQRVACRCLEALGDMQGLQMANQKLAEMELKTGFLIDNRVEGAALKVVNRHGFLRQSRRMLRR